MIKLAHLGIVRAIVIIAMVAATCVMAQGQVYRVRPIVRPRPMDTHIDSISIGATPSLVTFALGSGAVAQGSSGVNITTTWDSHGQTPQLSLYAYFNNSTAALSDGRSPTHLIPSFAVLGQVTSGIPTSFTPFTQTAAGFGAPGASLLLLNTQVGEVSRSGTRTDVLNLEIDLSGVSNLPAGVYTGTLTLQASIF
jgi:hypothetical protein